MLNLDKMAIKYSFIIPHKNCPSLLERCVNSIPVRNDVQIIVVDDNSDTGKKPCISRKDVEIICLDATHSKGAGRARNEGMLRAIGKWLLFADCDDYYADGFINVLDNYADGFFDVLYFNFKYLDGTTGDVLPEQHFQKYFGEFDGSKDAIDQIKYHHNVPWTKMVSRAFVDKYNITFEEVINGNDILFSMKVGYYSQKIQVDKTPLYVYLRNNNSILTSKETIEMALCRLTHLIKLNNFYSFIGHPEWKRSYVKRIVSKIRSLKIPFVIALCKELKFLYKGRNEWVSLFSV